MIWTVFHSAMPRTRLAVLVLVIGAVMAPASCHATPLSRQEFEARVVKATKDLADFSLVATVVEKNKKAMESVDSAYSRLYDFNAAKMSFKLPGKFKIEGKLGMVKFEYIVNGPLKIVRAPAVRYKSKEDYTNDPAKLQRPFDVGLITRTLWETQKVEILEDSEAEAAKEIKLELRWAKGDMRYNAWLDAEHLWLKRLEKRDSRGNLLVRAIYSNPKNIVGDAWMPTKLEVYAPNGDKAGATELSDIKVNMGLPDSMFE